MREEFARILEQNEYKRWRKADVLTWFDRAIENASKATVRKAQRGYGRMSASGARHCARCTCITYQVSEASTWSGPLDAVLVRCVNCGREEHVQYHLLLNEFNQAATL